MFWLGRLINKEAIFEVAHFSAFSLPYKVQYRNCGVFCFFCREEREAFPPVVQLPWPTTSNYKNSPFLLSSTSPLPRPWKKIRQNGTTILRQDRDIHSLRPPLRLPPAGKRAVLLKRSSLHNHPTHSPNNNPQPLERKKTPKQSLIDDLLTRCSNLPLLFNLPITTLMPCARAPRTTATTPTIHIMPQVRFIFYFNLVQAPNVLF